MSLKVSYLNDLFWDGGVRSGSSGVFVVVFSSLGDGYLKTFYYHNTENMVYTISHFVVRLQDMNYIFTNLTIWVTGFVLFRANEKYNSACFYPYLHKIKLITKVNNLRYCMFCP